MSWEEEIAELIETRGAAAAMALLARRIEERLAATEAMLEHRLRRYEAPPE